jgi:hypothetical protein
VSNFHKALWTLSSCEPSSWNHSVAGQIPERIHQISSDVMRIQKSSLYPVSRPRPLGAPRLWCSEGPLVVPLLLLAVAVPRTDQPPRSQKHPRPQSDVRVSTTGPHASNTQTGRASRHNVSWAGISDFPGGSCAGPREVYHFPLAKRKREAGDFATPRSGDLAANPHLQMQPMKSAEQSIRAPAHPELD